VLPAGGTGQVLAADMVVDATGRGGRTPVWLKALGYDPPAEERVEVDVKYASRYLRLPAGALGTEKLVGIGSEPAAPPTGMALLAQEGDRWILTLAGYAGHHPPTGKDRFLAFARDLAPPHIFAAIRGGNRSPRSAPTGSRPTCGGAMSGCAASPPGCWSSGTRSAASTRFTGRA
jgi:hypothetical protein